MAHDDLEGVVHNRTLHELDFPLRADKWSIDSFATLSTEEYGVTRLLDELEADLRDYRERLLVARRVWIPKPGTTERRPLSIPSVRDRIVQAALKMVIEPIFEADFQPCSFGLRPKRSTHGALQVLIDPAWRGRR